LDLTPGGVASGCHLGGPLEGVTKGDTLEVPWEVLRGVLPWRSVGKYYEGCYLEIFWEVLPWRSLGRCYERCYLGGPLGSITRGVALRSLGRCYLGGPLGGVTEGVTWEVPWEV
jgi:hypothetical protein